MHVWADLRVPKVIIIVIATHADTNALSDMYVCTCAHGPPILLCMYACKLKFRNKLCYKGTMQ